MEWFISTIKNAPGRVVMVFSIIVVICGMGMLSLGFDTSIRAYIDPQSQEASLLSKLEERFNRQENIIVLLSKETRETFRKEDIEYIDRLASEMWKVPFSRRVDAFTNQPLPMSNGNEVESTNIIDKYFNDQKIDIEEIQSRVNENYLMAGLVNRDFNATSVVIRLNPGENLASESSEALTYVEELLKKMEAPEGMQVNLMGTVLVNEAIKEAIINDAIFLVPATTTLIIVALFFVLKVFTGAILTTTILSLANIITIGIFGWLGTEVTPGAGAIPTMITIIAVADAIHLLTTYYHELSVGKTKADAIENSLRINIKPMFMTSLTTLVGLLCLNVSDSPPYRDMGNMVALGSAVAFLLCVVLLPAILQLLPVPKRFSENHSNQHFALVGAIGNSIVRNKTRCFVLAIIVAVPFILHLPENQLNDNWEDYYDETFSIKRAIDIQNERLVGAHFIEYMIEADPGETIISSKVIRDIDELSTWLKEQKEVRYVSSISEVIKAVNQAYDGESVTALLSSSEHLSQIYLLYEMSLPYGFGTEELVTLDKRFAKISVNLGSMHSDEMIKFNQRVKSWARANTNLDISEGTGVDMVFAEISDKSIYSLALGAVIALILVSIILIFVLNSVRLGLISLLPNLMPIALAYGLWGIMMSHIDMAVAMVAAMSLGLVADDTIHFISKYEYARRARNLTASDSVRYAFSTVGHAMLVTSIVLCLGFSLMIFSNFDPTWTMGALLSITILFALAFDFLVLPALLIWFEKKSEVDHRGDDLVGDDR